MNKRKKTGLAILSLTGVATVYSGLAYAAKITSIDFKNGTSASEIDIKSDGPITFDKQENASDKQIVLDLKDATLNSTASRKMDTSSFDSKVLLISPYQVQGGANESRVVIQLRDMAASTVTQDGNILRISVPNGASDAAPADANIPPPPGTAAGTGATAGNAGTANADANAAVDIPPPPPGDNSAKTLDSAPATNAATAGATDKTEVGKVTTTAEAAAEQNTVTGLKDKLSEFIEARETHRFTGRPITLKVRDADLMDVFRLIGDTSGFNIIVGDDVKGKITLSLEDVPWDQALDVILRTEKLGAERNNNLLRIVGLKDLTAEKQAELAAKIASDASAPRITRVFPISYAKLDDMVTILTKFSGNPTITAAAGAAGALAASPANTTSAVVQADSRTNSIIVRDTYENVERMKKLIDLLDTQTPQVLIEAKIVEATEGFSNSVGGELGFGKGTGNSQYFGSFAGADPIDPLFSTGGNSIYSAGSAINAAGAASGGNFALSPQLAFLPGNTRLNALLNLSESENTVRIVSSPKAVVLDKEKANIVQSTPVLVQTVAQTANGPVSTPTVQQANLSLDVSPTITNEGSVLMQLSVSDDVPFTFSGSSNTAVANRNMTTKVLVESGSTLVMGGIYTLDTSNSSSGFPILRKIPILGALFGTENNSTARSELFFFITPRILNLKESGLSG